jgi:hypothetical protein
MSSSKPESPAPTCDHNYVVAACPYGCTSSSAQHKAPQPERCDSEVIIGNYAHACGLKRGHGNRHTSGAVSWICPTLSTSSHTPPSDDKLNNLLEKQKLEFFRLREVFAKIAEIAKAETSTGWGQTPPSEMGQELIQKAAQLAVKCADAWTLSATEFENKYYPFAHPGSFRDEAAELVQKLSEAALRSSAVDAEWEKNIHEQLDTLKAPRADIDGNAFSINGRFAMLRSSGMDTPPFEIVKGHIHGRNCWDADGTRFDCKLDSNYVDASMDSIGEFIPVNMSTRLAPLTSGMAKEPTKEKL